MFSKRGNRGTDNEGIFDRHTHKCQLALQKAKRKINKNILLLLFEKPHFKCPVKFDPHVRSVEMDPRDKHSTTFLEMGRLMFSWFIIVPN